MDTKKLFSTLPGASITGTLPKQLTLLTDDSRKVVPGCCYVAVKGTQFDGHSVIDEVIAAGAVAIVAETPATAAAQAAGTCWVQVKDTKEACGQLMSAWYDFPSSKMVLLGVTGTNGKTTISYLVNHIFRAAWQRAGLIGTIIYDNGETRTTSSNTTPGSALLQSMLADMAKNGCRAVSMEVSSHALTQQRTAGTDFRVGIFTNLTQDHLDYHGTMEEYYQAKKLLFTRMAAADRKSTAVINIDDAYGRRLAEELAPIMKVRTYGENEKADFRALPKLISLKGSQYELVYQNRSYLVRTPLIGAFNLSNSLAALAGAVCAFFGQTYPAAALIFLALTAGGARLWAFASAKGISIRVSSKLRGLFPGEEAAFDIEVKNDKFLPVLWLELFCPLSRNLCISDIAVDLLLCYKSRNRVNYNNINSTRTHQCIKNTQCRLTAFGL